MNGKKRQASMQASEFVKTQIFCDKCQQKIEPRRVVSGYLMIKLYIDHECSKKIEDCFEEKCYGGIDDRLQ